jgi:hypothetical protein
MLFRRKSRWFECLTREFESRETRRLVHGVESGALRVSLTPVAVSGAAKIGFLKLITNDTNH